MCLLTKIFDRLKLFLPNTTVTKCCICEWVFKRCLIKIHKVTSLEYELQLCVVDQDLLQLKLFLPNTTVRKCCICEQKFQKMLDWNPQSDFSKIGTAVVCLLTKIFDRLKLFLTNTMLSCLWGLGGSNQSKEQRHWVNYYTGSLILKPAKVNGSKE